MQQHSCITVYPKKRFGCVPSIHSRIVWNKQFNSNPQCVTSLTSLWHTIPLPLLTSSRCDPSLWNSRNNQFHSRPSSQPNSAVIQWNCREPDTHSNCDCTCTTHGWDSSSRWEHKSTCRNTNSSYLHRAWIETLDILDHFFHRLARIHDIFDNQNRMTLQFRQIRFGDRYYRWKNSHFNTILGLVDRRILDFKKLIGKGLFQILELSTQLRKEGICTLQSIQKRTTTFRMQTRITRLSV